MKILDARRSGRVERLHTVPHHLPHNVASHSWGVATLIVLYHPDPSVRLLKAALLHDAAEAEVGDMPTPSKAAHGDIAERLSRIEHSYLVRVFDYPELDEDDSLWLRACDILDLALFCMDEIKIGNQFAKEVLFNCQNIVLKIAPPISLQEVIDHVFTYRA